MSVRREIRCDGCDLRRELVRMGPKHLLPVGWLRLRVSGRPAGDGGVFLGEIEVCSSECLVLATRTYFEDVSVPP